MLKRASYGTEHDYAFSLIICVVASGELHPAGRAVRKVQIWSWGIHHSCISMQPVRRPGDVYLFFFSYAYEIR